MSTPTRPSRVSARAALRATMERAMREAGAQSTLFGQAVADRLGISASDLDGLDVINLRGPMTAGELATATGLTTGAVTGLIDRLERAGLARRARDEADRRKVIVTLAPKTYERIAPHFEGLRRAMETLVSRYSETELRLLVEFFERSQEITVAQTKALRERGQAAPAERAGRGKPAAKRFRALP